MQRQQIGQILLDTHSGSTKLSRINDHTPGSKSGILTSILCPIESVDSSVPVCMKILKNSRWFWSRRAVGILLTTLMMLDKSMLSPGSYKISTARQDRNHLDFFKIFMQTATKLFTLSMGQSIQNGIQYNITPSWSTWKMEILLTTLMVLDKSMLSPGSYKIFGSAQKR